MRLVNFGTKECARHAGNTPESMCTTRYHNDVKHTYSKMFYGVFCMEMRVRCGSDRDMIMVCFPLKCIRKCLRQYRILYKLFVEFIWQIILSCCVWIRKAERKARKGENEPNKSGKYIQNAQRRKEENKRHLYYNVYAPAVDYLWKMVIVSKHETWFHVLRTMYKLNIFLSYRLQQRLFYQITKRLL